MALTLTIHPQDARSRPLPVRSRVTLRRDDHLEGVAPCRAGQTDVPFSPLVSHRVYTVAVSGSPFADSAMFVQLQDESSDAPMLCLVQAKHAAADLPDYARLPDALRQVLERSAELDLSKKAREIEARDLESRSLSSRPVGEDRQITDRAERQVRDGERRWNALDDESKAGLLNLYAKMLSVLVSAERRTVWSYIDRLIVVARDRVKARTQTDLKAATEASQAFRNAPEIIPIFHRPPPNFSRVGSWKTREPFGNLQLTFCAANEDPSEVQVDADVDDAASLGHGEQVIRNESRGLFKKIFGSIIPGLPDGTSHPYDIHQIVIHHQQPRPDPTGGIGKYVPCYRLLVDGVPPPYDI